SPWAAVPPASRRRPAVFPTYLPRFTLPRFTLPRFTLPRFTLPRFTLPRRPARPTAGANRARYCGGDEAGEIPRGRCCGRDAAGGDTEGTYCGEIPRGRRCRGDTEIGRAA